MTNKSLLTWMTEREVRGKGPEDNEAMTKPLRLPPIKLTIHSLFTKQMTAQGNKGYTI